MTLGWILRRARARREKEDFYMRIDDNKFARSYGKETGKHSGKERFALSQTRVFVQQV
jgi:hypothetical protein